MKFTYERDDGQARSWIDHIICSQSFSSLVSNVNIVNSGSILSDHFPLSFQIQVNCIFTSPSPSSSSTFTHLCVDWSTASSSDLEKFCDLVSQNLSPLPSEIISCCSTDCSCHRHLLDDYADHLVHTLLVIPFPLIPALHGYKNVVCWKDGVSKLKEATNFWHKVWLQAGCPSGVLFNNKKSAKSRYKYAHRRLMHRQHYLLQEKLSQPFCWDINKLKKSSKPHETPVIDGVSGPCHIANLFGSKLDVTLNTHSSVSRDSLLSSTQSCQLPIYLRWPFLRMMCLKLFVY